MIKDQKPGREGEEGGISEKEGAIEVSNVMLISPKCGKGTRLAHKMDGDSKMRVCKHCGETF